MPPFIVPLDRELIAASGDHDVPASFTNPELDGKRHRAPPERGIHLAESISRIQRTSEEF